MKGGAECFGLTLMVSHECNLRCTYCYTGAKFNRAMPISVGARAIERAFNSLIIGGRLELAFFGGEPLLEAETILAWMADARQRGEARQKAVRFFLTTNGTVTNRPAWTVMLADDLELAVSFDGTPEVHDRHRRDPQGNGSSSRVLACLAQLIEAGKSPRVVMVVRPDNLAEIPAGLEFLHRLGIQQVDLSLDLWTSWTAGDGVRLGAMLSRAAKVWRSWLPQVGVNWFDAKLAELTQMQRAGTTPRCGFGGGEIAVAPSGRLYPCERLIGEDLPNNLMVLPGHALEGDDFCGCDPAPLQACGACAGCAMKSACDTYCRCANYLRTGDVNRPDGLLCLLNKGAMRAVVDALEEIELDQDPKMKPQTRSCYVA